MCPTSVREALRSRVLPPVTGRTKRVLVSVELHFQRVLVWLRGLLSLYVLKLFWRRGVLNQRITVPANTLIIDSQQALDKVDNKSTNSPIK